MCGNVWLHAPSASVTPAPENPSASALLSEPDQHSPAHQVSVKKFEEFSRIGEPEIQTHTVLLWVLLSNLVSEHECDYFQNMQTPLLLTLGRGQELDQVIEAANVKGPQHSVVDAGIVIHFLWDKQTDFSN